MDRVGVRDGADRADPRALVGFVRALVGVGDAAVEFGSDGRVATLWIVPAPGVPERQVRMNVVSALMAGPGIALDPAALRFTLSLPDPAAPPAPAPPPEAAPGLPGRNGRGSSSPALNGSTRAHAHVQQGASEPGREPDPSSAGLHMTRFEIEHPAPGRIRVIVGVLAGDHPGLGVREGDDRPGVAMELAARAAADAARGAGAIGDAFQLAGVALTEVAGRTHVVAAVDVWTGSDFAARPGAAAVLASYEEAAARATLAALCRY